MYLVGSSISIMDGFDTNSIPIDNLFDSPPEIFSTRVDEHLFNFSTFIMLDTIFFFTLADVFPGSLKSAAYSSVSRTVSFDNSENCCVMYDIPT